MIETISTNNIAPIHSKPGDKLFVTCTDIDGNVHEFDPVEFDEPTIIDTAIFLKVKEDLGLKNGIGVVLGEGVK